MTRAPTIGFRLRWQTFPRLGLLAALVISTCANSLLALTPTPTGISSPRGSPTPTATSTATPVLLAIDNVVAVGSTQFSTGFEGFASATLAENLTLSGMTFTPDPPGTWQIVVSNAAPFGAPFRTLTGNVLYQPSTPGTLIIAFGAPVSTFSCGFAVNQSRGTAGLTVQGYHGTTLVGSVTQLTTTGTAFGEGAITLASANTFDKVRLSSVLGPPTPTPIPTSGSIGPSRNPSAVCCGVNGGAVVPMTGGGCAIGPQGSGWPAPLVLGLLFLVGAARFRGKRWSDPSRSGTRIDSENVLCSAAKHSSRDTKASTASAACAERGS